MSGGKPHVSVSPDEGLIQISGSGEAEAGSATGPHSFTDVTFSFGDPGTSAIVRFLVTGSVRPSEACGNFEPRANNPHTCLCGYMRDSHDHEALGEQK